MGERPMPSAWSQLIGAGYDWQFSSLKSMTLKRSCTCDYDNKIKIMLIMITAIIIVISFIIWINFRDDVSGCYQS